MNIEKEWVCLQQHCCHYVLPNFKESSIYTHSKMVFWKECDEHSGVMRVLVCVLTSWATMNVSRDIPYRNERADMTQNQHAAVGSNSSHSALEGGNIVLQTANTKNRCIKLDPTLTLPARTESFVLIIPLIQIFLLLLHMFYFFSLLSAPQRTFFEVSFSFCFALWLSQSSSLFFFFTDLLQPQLKIPISFSSHLYFVCWLKHKLR